MQQHVLRNILAGWLLAALLAALPASAQDENLAPEIRRYDVEIILFRYGPGTVTGNEQFLPDAQQDDSTMSADAQGDLNIPVFSDQTPTSRPPRNETEELAELDLPTVNVGVAITPRARLRLGATYDKLKLLDAYEPVMWTGWTQDAVERDVSPAIPLRRLGNAPADFDGTVKLYLNRFLHLVVDLTLTERDSRAASAGRSVQQGAPIHLRINEDRIMKNGDLRYYDHPKFGLLAKVTRVDEAAADRAGEPAVPAAR
ncbi:MAG: CsiV family protein [Woeseia sp.]